jgi:hypothetical protein
MSKAKEIMTFALSVARFLKLPEPFLTGFVSCSTAKDGLVTRGGEFIRCFDPDCGGSLGRHVNSPITMSHIRFVKHQKRSRRIVPFHLLYRGGAQAAVTFNHWVELQVGRYVGGRLDMPVLVPFDLAVGNSSKSSGFFRMLVHHQKTSPLGGLDIESENEKYRYTIEDSKTSCHDHDQDKKGWSQ